MMEDRVTRLEVRVAFLENTLEELDRVVRDLNLQAGMLQREVDRLRGAEPTASEQQPVAP